MTAVIQAKRKMPVGMDDFKKIRETCYFVDKTSFISDFLRNHNEVTLLTRPRRFGKTLLMSMMDCFLSMDRKDECRHLFDGLMVSRDAVSMQEQGARPVVSLTFKDIKQPTWQYMLGSLAACLSQCFSRHLFLEDSHALTDTERMLFRRICRKQASYPELSRALLDLTRMLRKHFGKPAVVLLDEYDTPVQYAWQQGFYDDCIAFMKVLLGSVLKGNSSLDFALVTGVLRIAKESIFSGLNNLDVCSVIRPKFSSACGFTKDEINSMAKDLDFEDKLWEVADWYDGYRFSGIGIYNPWSVVSYIDNGFRARAYWANTSGNGILRKLLPQASGRRARDLRELLGGKPLFSAVDEGVIYSGIESNEDALLTMLLTTGYLTPAHDADMDSDMLPLVIPNNEIRKVYAKEILEVLASGACFGDYRRMLEQMLRGDAERFGESLQSILSAMASAFDTASDKQEAFYHGLMLGLVATLHGNGYQVKSNGESGNGRFDIAIFPMDASRPGVLMEFKAASGIEGLRDLAQEARKQIDAKGYMEEFRSRGIGTVWGYGIAFAGKSIALAADSGKPSVADDRLRGLSH